MSANFTRLELLGGVETQNAKPIKFHYGLLPWAIKRPLVLLLDGFDARRPEAKCVFNDLLKAGGELVGPEAGRPVRPNACFRLLATCDATTEGPDGTFRANADHFDGWHLVLNMARLSPAQERNLIRLSAAPSVEGKIATVLKLLRKLKAKKKLTTALTYGSLRSWCERFVILNDVREAFEHSHLSKCPAEERPLVKRCFEATFAGNAH